MKKHLNTGERVRCSALMFVFFGFAVTSGLANPTNEDRTMMIERVKTAMLSMQRASWEQGLAAQAFVELQDEPMIVLMAREAVLRQTEDGRLSVLYTDNGVTDPAASGEAVLVAARLTGDPALTAAVGRMKEYLMTVAPRAPDGTLHHTIKEPEIWVDSIYMAPPFLALVGEHEEAVKQVRGMRRVLLHEPSGLYAHRWDTAAESFVNSKHWGVGNGWVAAGILRVVEALPESMSEEREELVGYVKGVLDACAAFMREDGLFHDIVDDSDTFVETNLSQMFAYTIFAGVASGWLENKRIPVALKMREAAWNKVDSDGYVQDVCGAPFFNSPGRATEGQAFFLLMESAYARWVKAGHPGG